MPHHAIILSNQILSRIRRDLALIQQPQINSVCRGDIIERLSAPVSKVNVNSRKILHSEVISWGL